MERPAGQARFLSAPHVRVQATRRCACELVARGPVCVGKAGSGFC